MKIKTATEATVPVILKVGINVVFVSGTADLSTKISRKINVMIQVKAPEDTEGFDEIVSCPQNVQYCIGLSHIAHIVEFEPWTLEYIHEQEVPFSSDLPELQFATKA